MNTEHPFHAGLGEITPELQSRLDELARDPATKSKPDSLTSAQRAVLFDIASLQVKAKRTFGESLGDSLGRSEAWWVTRLGLQQSTHHRVARLKASWMGDSVVADVCCGLGSDLIALAQRGIVVGLDIDSDVLAFAAANLRVGGVTGSLQSLDVTTTSPDRIVGDAEYLHLDPDRRANGHRHTDADDLVPSWDRVCELVARSRGGIVKLAPATRLPDEMDRDWHRTWISTSGSVREQSAITGGVLDHPWLKEHAMVAGNRSAITIRDETALVFVPTTDAGSTQQVDGKGIGEWIIDPDASIRAAGLTEAFARETGSRLIDAASGFLTCERIDEASTSLLMAMTARVIDVIGCDDRKLRKYFRARDGYPEIIKVRGGDVDPGKLARRLKDCGSNPLGLWISRQGKRTYAAVTEMPHGTAAFPG